jgi:transposase
MQVLYTRCAGLEVHKDTVVACVRCVSPPIQEVSSFGTTTTELRAQARDLVSDRNSLSNQSPRK